MRWLAMLLGHGMYVRFDYIPNRLSRSRLFYYEGGIESMLCITS